jgi:CheY-like chemotaxis protein
MENVIFSYGPGVVQLLQARGLRVREHLKPVLQQVAEFASKNADPLLTGRYVVGLVASLEGSSAETDFGEAWCGAVESMFRHAEAGSRPAALIVESDPVQRKYAATILARTGITVNAVAHVDGALLCDSLRYDFILLDNAWPTGRGAELAEGIRAGQGPNTNTYILGTSGNFARQECMAAGMDSFLQKPIDKATLKALALRAASGTLTVSSVS